VSAKLLPFRRPGAAPTVSEAALVAACAVGDGEALGALFDLHHREVERFIGRLAWCNPAELADLVQNTFLEVRRAARRFRGESSVKTWIFSIAVNVARRHARSERRRRSLLADAGVRPLPAVTAVDDVVAHRQQIVRVERALAELKPELREAFVLCDLEDVRGAEAARILGIREGTLWWRLHMARKALRAACEGEAP
jgi:RNA polymerase sigma-70 factor (ECF subfamily)